MNNQKRYLLTVAFIFGGLVFLVGSGSAQALPKELAGTTWEVVTPHAKLRVKFKDARDVSLSYDDEDQAIDWTGTYTATADRGFSASFTDYDVDSIDGASKGKGTLKITGKYYLSDQKKPVMKLLSLSGQHAYMLDFLPQGLVLELIK